MGASGGLRRCPTGENALARGAHFRLMRAIPNILPLANGNVAWRPTLFVETQKCFGPTRRYQQCTNHNCVKSQLVLALDSSIKARTRRVSRRELG